jgi:hypothetical protein
VDEEVLAGGRQLMRRFSRSNSGMPTCDSTSLICIDTAGGVRCRASAAAVTLPCWATSTNTRNWRKVTFIKQKLNLKLKKV